MRSQNRILAWVVVLLGLAIAAYLVISFNPAPSESGMRGLSFFLFLIPIAFSVFFLSRFENFLVAAAVFFIGAYSVCWPRYAVKPYYLWPVDKGIIGYIFYLSAPMVDSGLIWQLILLAIFTYWLGALSEKMKSSVARYQDTFSNSDDLLFAAQQEKARFLALQKKHNEDVNRLNSMIIMLSDLAKEIPSVLEIEGLFKLLLDRSVKLFSAINCAIFLVDHSTNRLKYVCSVGYSQDTLMSLNLTADQESGLPGWCAKNAKFLSLKEMERNAYMSDIVKQNKFPVAFCQPITDKGKSIAIICIGDTEREFSEKEIMRLASILANVSTIAIQNARLMEKTKEQAIRDGLTGLYNHRHFYELLEGIMKDTGEAGPALGIFLIDIDHFKKFNDTYGHQFGDMILQETAGIIQKQIQKTDIAARYGGEEFAVICARNDTEAVKKVAEDMRKAVEASVFQCNNLKLSVTISAGIAFYDFKTGMVASELVKHSDEALYKAKESGRNKVCFYGGK